MANTMTLSVDTGAINIDLRDKDGDKLGEFKFNPMDSGIISRYGTVVDFFNSVEFSDNLSQEQEIEKVKELDAAICEQFDYLLGYKVSGGMFASCGPLTVTSNGDFFFESILDGIGDLIEKISKQRLEKKLDKVRAAVAESEK